ncbi:hypothetical protein CVT26_007818 [Gymnopilus dilepis]|uniref:Uncharacterized protein n=1 Tax=Gymnopilus dilepis TaxID=231916 RepID=A0A409W7Q2_9AGAR|nr:hypothetical protein CVT26_007818 [Gymnopilus dilepis]
MSKGDSDDGVFKAPDQGKHQSCDYCAEIEDMGNRSSWSFSTLHMGEKCRSCISLEQLEMRITETKILLADLFSQRREARHLFNKNHPTIVDRMPVEVASAIFEAYAQESSPLVLGAVCRSWRRIAWSTPRVWAILTVNVERLTTEAMFDIARDWLLRSDRSLLSLRFRRGNSANLSFKYLGPFLEMVNQHSPRWFSLDLSLPSSIIRRFKESGGASSALTTLKIWATDGSQSVDLSLSRCLPTEVRFTNIPLRAVCFKWTNVSIISISGVSVYDILDLLRQAPCLRDGYFVNSGNLHPYGNFRRNSLIIHGHLEELEIVHLNAADLSFFFNAVQLPALTTLTCELNGPGTLDDNALTSFVTRSLCPLKTLSLHSVAFAAPDLIQIAKHFPWLRRFDVYSLDDQLMLPFFEALGNDFSGAMLPCLEIFSWTVGTPPKWDFIPSFFQTFDYGGVVSRRPLQSLSIYCNSTMDFALEDKDFFHYINPEILQKLESERLVTGIAYDFEVSLSSRGFDADLLKLSFNKVQIEDDGYDEEWIKYGHSFPSISSSNGDEDEEDDGYDEE